MVEAEPVDGSVGSNVRNVAIGSNGNVPRIVAVANPERRRRQEQRIARFRSSGRNTCRRRWTWLRILIPSNRAEHCTTCGSHSDIKDCLIDARGALRGCAYPLGRTPGGAGGGPRDPSARSPRVAAGGDTLSPRRSESEG